MFSLQLNERIHTRTPLARERERIITCDKKLDQLMPKDATKCSRLFPMFSSYMFFFSYCHCHYNDRTTSTVILSLVLLLFFLFFSFNSSPASVAFFVQISHCTKSSVRTGASLRSRRCSAEDHCSCSFPSFVSRSMLYVRTRPLLRFSASSCFFQIVVPS